MISLIVCTYNREKYLYDALCHIANNHFAKSDYEVVLVDNNSTDSTPTLCSRFAQEHPGVQFRYFVEQKQGLSHARNRGIAEAKGEVLVFLDDDSFIDTDYLSNLNHQLTAHPDAMAFGGRISPLFEEGVEPAWLCKWTYSWVSAIDLGKQVQLFQGNVFPIGANMGFRRQCITEVGDFNTQLGRSKKNMMSGEEKDIFNRVRAKGYSIYYFPDVYVQHVIPPHRTTAEFISRLGEGVGMSERLRCLAIGRGAYIKRLGSEAYKWAGTLVLSLAYALRGRSAVSRMILLFRRRVTHGLLTPYTE